MVMSLTEQVTALEEEYSNAKGPGSKEKRKVLQAKIDELKKADSPTDEEKPVAEIKRKPFVAPTPIPEYREVTLEEVQEAEKNGKLCGFSPENMTASIRD